MSCVKHNWQDFEAQFKTENPRIEVLMVDGDVNEKPHEDIGHTDTNGLTSLESIKVEPEEISNKGEINIKGTIELSNEPSNNEILSFLRDNELTDKEMDWLKSHGIVTEFGVLKLIGQIMSNRSSE